MTRETLVTPFGIDKTTLDQMVAQGATFAHVKGSGGVVAVA